MSSPFSGDGPDRAAPHDASGQAGLEASYAVKLPAFEGPLDLLLHLIRLNEVDITEIPIQRVASQYVEYLALMRELDLDVAGEYLLMAATLAWIKSRMLLPPEPSEDDEEGADPRAELIARLLEYQRFKEAAQELGERPLLERDVYAAEGAEPASTPEAEREIEVGLFQLLEAFRDVLGRASGPAGPHEVETESITVHERMLAVMGELEGHEVLEFGQIIAAVPGRASRAMIVTTFLALLELTRLAAIRIFQSVGDDGAPRGPIQLRRGDLSAADWGQRISEIM